MQWRLPITVRIHDGRKASQPATDLILPPVSQFKGTERSVRPSFNFDSSFYSATRPASFANNSLICQKSDFGRPQINVTESVCRSDRQLSARLELASRRSRGGENAFCLFTQLDVLGSVGGVQDGFLPGFEGPVDRHALDVELQFARQQVTQHHGGQEINGVSRLPENLLGAVGEDARRHVVWVVLFLYSHAKPAGGRPRRTI